MSQPSNSGTPGIHAPTIFDKILAGDIPSHRVYEDEHVLAFLDIGPLSVGHTLVIPKERRAHLHELSDDAAAALGRVLPRLCRAVLRATGATAYNVLQNNGAAAHQVVMHVHFHIIPKHGSQGLGIGWPAGKLDAADARELVAKMTAALAADGAAEDGA
ncbi:MAG TPA: HIT family protein [Thermoanaerobaculia bacterium]|nr:HIT family protein [Thermoanaerobaculia bacterium]